MCSNAQGLESQGVPGALGLSGQVLLQKHSAHVHGAMAMEEKQHFTQTPWHFQVPFLIFPISAPVLSQPGWEHSAEGGQWPDKR